VWSAQRIPTVVNLGSPTSGASSVGIVCLRTTDHGVFIYIFMQSVRLLGRGMSPSQGRYLHRTTQTQNKSTQTSMHRVGFELTITAFQREKTVPALDHAATVISSLSSNQLKLTTNIRMCRTYILLGCLLSQSKCIWVAVRMLPSSMV
jgi:hypothetical protein